MWLSAPLTPQDTDSAPAPHRSGHVACLSGLAALRGGTGLRGTSQTGPQKNKVVLLSYGDPYIATTHIELRTRAIEEKIKTQTIHASSSLTSMIGECGLHYYKIGRVCTKNVSKPHGSWSFSTSFI